MTRKTFIYPVPDGFLMLLEVIKCLRGDNETENGWSRLPASLVAVESLSAAIYLRATFEDRPEDINGVSLLEDHEVWVHDQDRQECERLLAENCPSPAQWYDLLQVSFATEDEHRQFAAAYTAVTRLENAFSPVPRAPE